MAKEPTDNIMSDDEASPLDWFFLEAFTRELFGPSPEFNSSIKDTPIIEINSSNIKTA